MSVNHNLLPVSNDELDALLAAPASIVEFLDSRRNETTRIGTDGVAIVALTARGPTDLLAFMMDGAPPEFSGWLGKYVEKDGRVIECEVDVGYGPASYYRNQFLQDVARELVAFTEDDFDKSCDMALLEKYNVYPAGWTNEGRRESLIAAFKGYRNCILGAARSGRHLLVWCD